jgi:hypothetical protein
VSHDAKIGLLLLAAVIFYIVVMGGITYMVLLAGSVADRPDDTAELEEEAAA